MIGGDSGDGPVRIAGGRYPRSISASLCTIYSDQPTYSWRLDGGYRQLRATVGLEDASDSHDAVASVVLRADGAVIWSGRLTYGRALPVRAGIAGASVISASFTEIGCGDEPDAGAAAALGSVRVIR